MNQSFHGQRFISLNIFNDFTSERAKTTDFSVNTYTTDLFSENLTDSVLERSKLFLSQEKLFERKKLIFLNQIQFLETRENYLSQEIIGLSVFKPIFS